MEPDFDATKFYLGRLCKRGHDWNGTGMSLRYINSGCRNCTLERGKQRWEDPVIKARTNKQMTLYRQTDVVKAREKQRWKRRLQDPEDTAKRRQYFKNLQQDPDRKRRERERNKKRRQDPGYRAKYKAWRVRHEQDLNVRTSNNERRKKYRKNPSVRTREREYQKQWIQDPSRRLNANISRRVRKSLQNGKQGRSWTTILPYTLTKLTVHLESQFTPEMTWENYGTYWHIDHIIPLSSFILNGPDDPLIGKAWGLDNLRPLHATTNKIKGNGLTLTTMPPSRKRKR